MLAQRLVRRLCAESKAVETALDALIKRFGMTRLAPAEAIALYHAVGYPACRGIGFHGRRAIAELLVPKRAIDRVGRRLGHRTRGGG